MTSALQVMSLSVVCAVIAVLVREKAGTLAMLLSLIVCVASLLLVLRFFAPILEFTEKLRELSGLDHAVTAPLTKVAGLGILTQISCNLCEDAGEKTLAITAEICGTVFAVYVSLPLMTTVLELLKDVLGG